MRPATSHPMTSLSMRSLPLALLLACTGKEEETGTVIIDTLPHDSDSTDPCPGGTPPVIAELTLENTGLQEYEAGEFFPTLTIRADATDEDWDLSSYHFDVWFDETVDGAVEQGSDGLQVLGTVVEEECGAPSANIGMQIFLRGGGVEYNTLYEWGGIVTDANGYVSEMAITSGYTPTSEGEDGGA